MAGYRNPEALDTSELFIEYIASLPDDAYQSWQAQASQPDDPNWLEREVAKAQAIFRERLAAKETP